MRLGLALLCLYSDVGAVVSYLDLTVLVIVYCGCVAWTLWFRNSLIFFLVLSQCMR